MLATFFRLHLCIYYKKCYQEVWIKLRLHQNSIFPLFDIAPISFYFCQVWYYALHWLVDIRHVHSYVYIILCVWYLNTFSKKLCKLTLALWAANNQPCQPISSLTIVYSFFSTCPTRSTVMIFRWSSMSVIQIWRREIQSSCSFWVTVLQLGLCHRLSAQFCHASILHFAWTVYPCFRHMFICSMHAHADRERQVYMHTMLLFLLSMAEG